MTATTLNGNAKAPRAPFTSLQRAALDKTFYRLMPILTIAYFFSYLDRQCIAMAALTMNKDLGLTATQFGYASGLFFIMGYVLFEIPSNMALYRFGARIWIARIMFTWGLVLAATAFVTDVNGLYVMRFLLGVAEAGFFPGITYLLSTWFPQEYRAKVLVWFLVALPASSAIGNPMAGLLMELDGMLGLAGWKWVFIALGIPSALLGFVVLKLLPDKADGSPWLTREETEAVEAMRAAEKHDRPKSSLWAACKDPRVIMLGFIQFGFTTASYGIGAWLPLIIKTTELSNVATGFLAAVPYIFGTIGMIIWAHYADRSGQKLLNVAGAGLVGAAGFVAYIFSGSLFFALASITVALIAISAMRAVFWTIPARILTGAGAAGGLAYINAIGTTGGMVGPALVGVFKDMTGGFTYGVLSMAVVMALTALLAGALKLSLRHE